MPCACGSGKETVLIYACSGAANTGLLADLLFQHLPLSRERKAWAMAEGNVTRRAEAALAWLDGLADAAEA